MKMDGSEQCDPEACMERLNTTEFVLLFIGEGACEIHRRIITDQWVKLDMTEFGLLFIGMGAGEVHRGIIADQWVERNPYPG